MHVNAAHIHVLQLENDPFSSLVTKKLACSINGCRFSALMHDTVGGDVTPGLRDYALDSNDSISKIVSDLFLIHLNK